MRANLSLNHAINITPYIDILLVLLIIFREFSQLVVQRAGIHIEVKVLRST